MKKLILILCLLATGLAAGDFNLRRACLWYCDTNTVGGVTYGSLAKFDVQTSPQLVGTNMVMVSEITRWDGSLPTQPTKTYLEGQWPTVEAWWPVWVKKQECRVADMQQSLRRFALLVLDEINILRVAASLPPRTIEQLEAAMQAKP